MGYLDKPRYGERFWEEGRKFSGAEYNFTNPYDRKGEPRLYLKILRLLALEGPAKKKDILKKLGLFRESATNHYNDVFHALSETGLAFYHPKSRSWRLGPHYHSWVNEFIGPNSEQGAISLSPDEMDPELAEEMKAIQEIIDKATPQTSFRMPVKVVKKRSLRPNELIQQAVQTLKAQDMHGIAEALTEERCGKSLVATVTAISEFLIIDILDHRHEARKRTRRNR